MENLGFSTKRVPRDQHLPVPLLPQTQHQPCTVRGSRDRHRGKTDPKTRHTTRGGPCPDLQPPPPTAASRACTPKTREGSGTAGPGEGTPNLTTNHTRDEGGDREGTREHPRGTGERGTRWGSASPPKTREGAGRAEGAPGGVRAEGQERRVPPSTSPLPVPGGPGDIRAFPERLRGRGYSGPPGKGSGAGRRPGPAPG